MSENELCTLESYTRIIRLNFPEKEKKLHFSLQGPIMSFFDTTGNISTETYGPVVVTLALRACVWIQAYFPGNTCQVYNLISV